MVRRILQSLALLALLLGSPALGLAGPEPARACGCCGEGDAPDPCGMPNCPPRCPSPGPSMALAAPAPAQAQVRQAAQRRQKREREPQPWPCPRPSLRADAQFRPASPANGPPPGTALDRQARLRCFRI